MNREIKFRAWNTVHKKMSNSFTLLDCINQDQIFALPENFEFMQYTGLTDKNGVEIYEGDIVRDSIGGAYSVVFKDGEFTKNWPMLFLSPSSDEVIGNIYENPELLEDNND